MVPLTFDPEKKCFEASVRDLADDPGFRRIGFDRREGWLSVGAGAARHLEISRLRRDSFSSYQSEVFLRESFSVDDWTGTITGRLDGMVETAPGTWLIEEFKSAAATGEIRQAGYPFDFYKRQVLFYAWLWHRQNPATISCRLVYLRGSATAETAVDVSYDAGEVEKEFQLRLRRLKIQCEAEAAARREKIAAADALPFPHSEPRPGQHILMNAVRDTIHSENHLLAEAPTGSGKTAAGLYPALQAGLRQGKQIFFLTSKNLQQRMAVAAMREMNSSGSFRTIQLRSKEKMCANGQVLCHEDFCPYARNYPEKMTQSGLLDRLLRNQSHFEPDAVFAAAKQEQVCPFEVQLELARHADAVTGDYNYLFEPASALRHLFDEGLQNILPVIDEAHNLADRVRKIYSPELIETDFLAARRFAISKPGELFEDLARSIDGALGLIHAEARVLDAAQRTAEIDPPIREWEEFWLDWEATFVRYIVWKQETRTITPEDPIVDFHYKLQRWISVLALFGPGFTCIIEQRSDGPRLAVLCLDPARILSPMFRKIPATIFLSATLSPLEATRRCLGLEPDRTKTVVLPPPFPRENRRVLILPQVETSYTNRARYQKQTARLIREMFDAQPGNTLVLFPSYGFLAGIAELLKQDENLDLICQRADWNETERNAIFQRLRSPNQKSLLCAVLGGMYAEGVDYPQRLLSGVFIVSPGLPQVSFERELLRRYFDSSEESGFAHAYLYPGMTRVIQAAGRLIRSENDRGVIALICRRFLREPYAGLLPRDWYDDAPSQLIATNPVAEIERFFAERAVAGDEPAPESNRIPSV
jgi:DNA excision repair protein ERCC-2